MLTIYIHSNQILCFFDNMLRRLKYYAQNINSSKVKFYEQEIMNILIWLKNN